MTKLSKQQARIAEMIHQGLPVSAIAPQLKLTEGSVRQYLHHIYTKLQIKGRKELAAWWGQGGQDITEPPKLKKIRSRLSFREYRDLIVRLRFRDGDVCCFCNTPIDFSKLGWEMSMGPSLHLTKRPGGHEQVQLTDADKKLAHRECNPDVTTKDLAAHRKSKEKERSLAKKAQKESSSAVDISQANEPSVV